MGFNSFLKKAIPMLATAIPIPGVGALAATILGNALGVNDVTPENAEPLVAASLAKDPDGTMAKLREAEQSFQVRMAELGYDNVQKLEEIAAADRANARGREVAVKDRLPGILALATTAGFFMLVITIAFHIVPAESREPLMLLLGTLGSAWISIMTYFFGSSAGSAAKTKIISEQLDKQ